MTDRNYDESGTFESLADRARRLALTQTTAQESALDSQGRSIYGSEPYYTGYDAYRGQGEVANPQDDNNWALAGNKAWDAAVSAGRSLGQRVTVNGKQYWRVGNGENINPNVAPDLVGKAIYDPTYGYVVDDATWQQHLARLKSMNEDSTKWFMGGLGLAAIPFGAALGAGIGGLEGGSIGGIGGGAGGTAGTIGAEAGAFGAGAIPAELSWLPAETLASLGYTPEAIAAASAAGGATAFGGTGLASSIAPNLLTSGALSNAATAGLGGGLTESANWWQRLFTPSGTPSTATSGLGRLLGLSGAGSDLLNALGSAGIAGLGAYTANRQADKLGELADEYKAFGAPYRQRLSDLYANPEGFLNSPEVQKPVQQGTDMLARSLSIKGNPAGSGNALQQLQSYSADQLFGRLGQEKDRLAGFGGLASYNAAAPAAQTNAINQQGQALGAIGGGLADVFNPPKTSTQMLSELMKMLGRT